MRNKFYNSLKKKLQQYKQIVSNRQKKLKSKPISYSEPSLDKMALGTPFSTADS